MLVTTYQIRDTGAKDYDTFIRNTFKAMGETVSEEVKKYYLDSNYAEHSHHLRRMRFCIPVFLFKLCYNKYKLKLRKVVKYKNLVTLVMFFEPRSSMSALGSWPPVPEIQQIMDEKIYDLSYTNGKVAFEPLSSPSPQV